MTGTAALATEWADLLERRPAFREPLAPYSRILAAWARWPGDRIAPLEWGAEACRTRWQRGAPLLADTTPSIPVEAMEDLLGVALESLATLGEDPAALRRFAEAWDRGDIGPPDLVPGPGRVGSVAAQAQSGLDQEGLAFLAYGSLRPVLGDFFVRCAQFVADAPWDLGICPCCGGPPGFADLLDDGRRRLACHLCAATWVFSRLRCPYCGSRNAADLVRLQAEDKEEGYLISACRSCQGYLKELDRRVRWNAGSALVEDWGSPHLDLVAQRAGYWRPVPTLIRIGGTA